MNSLTCAQAFPAQHVAAVVVVVVVVVVLKCKKVKSTNNDYNKN